MNVNSFSLAKNKTTNMLLVFGVLIFIYTLTRAYLISITWDESHSYHEYIKNNIVLLDKQEDMSANNHILNTLGGIIFTSIFGISEFTLRISSLIAHLFFIFYSAKLISTFENKWIALSAFFILNLNPYMLDFFSLARGYSISLGFMMASIYYFYCFHLNKFNTKNAIASILFAELATLGNFTLLNYCVVLYGLIGVLIAYKNYRVGDSFALMLQKTIKEMLLPTLLFFLFLWFVLPITFDLRAAGALFFGGENGLWTDTVGTIMPRLWYGLDFSPWLQRLTKATVLIVLFTSTIYVGYKYARKKASQSTLFLSSLLALFFLIILSTIVQHILLGTLYLIERTVLFLFVLWLLIFVFFIYELYSERKIVQTIMHLLAVFIFVHFLFSFNFKYVYEWKDDCETKEMLSDLAAIKEQPAEKFNISVGIPLTLESSINYYRGVNNLSWLNQTRRSKQINYLNDYFFLRPIDLDEANSDSLEIIKTYPVTKNSLAKPKYPFTKATVVVDSIIEFGSGNFKIDTGTVYSPGFNYIYDDSMPQINSLLSCKVDFQAEENFTGNIYLITTYQNKEGMYSWISTKINDCFVGINKPSEASSTTFIPNEVKQGDEIKIYIWNPNQQQLQIKKMQLKWINYSY